MMHKPLKISVISVPFSGHFKVLAQLAKELKKKDQQIDLTVVVTSWNNVRVSQTDAAALQAAGIKVVELTQAALSDAAPMRFTFPRVAALSDQVIEQCKASDYLIYDFFALEGYIAGQVLNIPAICSVPAIMGPFNPANALLKQGIEDNQSLIQSLEGKYSIELNNGIQMVSDGFLIPSEYKTILWSWPALTKASRCKENRANTNYVMMRPDNATDPQAEVIETIKRLKDKKKIIYVSLGTVVTANLWNNVPQTRGFIKSIFNDITAKYANDERYEVVVSTGRPIVDLFPSIPSNFHVYESVPQQALLPYVDVFVTHGGGNGVNEAIDAEAPMVVIPFFGDQHLCADTIQKLKIGIALTVDEKEKDCMVDTNHCHIERNSMKKGAFIDAIETILADGNYRQRIKKLKQDKPLPVAQLGTILKNEQVLNWQEGDLLYGCNDDRLKLAEITGRTDYFRIGNTNTFSTLFSAVGTYTYSPYKKTAPLRL